MKQNSIKVWELSLLLALCLSLCVGVFEAGRQAELSGKLLRLHVVAQGNSQGQQELKLQVRDAVLAVLQPMLEGSESAEQAAQAIEQGREEILLAARSAAQGESVELVFGRESYPSRYGEAYALPAGEYTSLRIIIGEGKGRNWWGVIFPQLSPVESCELSQSVSALDEQELSMIYQPGDYELSFRILELLQLLREHIGK